MFPTFADLADRTNDVPSDCTGVSLVPTLMGKSGEQKQRDYLYWSFYEGGMGQAVRTRDWKLVEQPFGTPSRLYEINSDLQEQHDVANRFPNIVAELTAKMNQAYEPGEGPWVLRSARK